MRLPAHGTAPGDISPIAPGPSRFAARPRIGARGKRNLAKCSLCRAAMASQQGPIVCRRIVSMPIGGALLHRPKRQERPVRRRPQRGVGEGLWFENARKRAGLPRLTPHSLLHTAASLSMSAGTNVKAVQRMLGHNSAAMTLDVYPDLFDDGLEAVAIALDHAIASESVGTVWGN